MADKSNQLQQASHGHGQSPEVITPKSRPGVLGNMMLIPDPKLRLIWPD